MRIPPRIFAVAPAVLVLYSIGVVCYFSPVKAQTAQLAEDVWTTKAQVGDLRNTVAQNQLVVQALQAKVDALSDRQARMETTVESIAWLVKGALAGIIAILLERVFALATKKRKSDEGSGSFRAME